jgi:hypothetical protein
MHIASIYKDIYKTKYYFNSATKYQIILQVLDNILATIDN